MDEDDEIVGYDCTLRDIESVMGRAKRTGRDPEALTHDEARRVVGRDTKMVGDIEEALTGGYDLAFIVLSEPYYVAISEALEDIPPKIIVLAFASKGSSKYLSDAYWAPATEEVRKELGSNNFRLRGELLKTASEGTDESDLAKFTREPETIVESISAVQNEVYE